MEARMITLIVSFLVAHAGALLGLMAGAGGVLFGMFSHKSAQATKEKAAATVARAQATVQAGNAAAALTGEQDAANMTAATQQAAATPDANLDAQLQQLGALRKD
jgi:hypothetical protein